MTTLANGWAEFLSVFPDSNVYMGAIEQNGVLSDGGGEGVVARYLPASGQMDAKWWIADSRYAGANEYLDAASICSPTPQSETFCLADGAQSRWLYDTGSGSEFGVASANGGGTAMEYYPTLKTLTTEVANVTVAQGVIGDLLLAGTTASGSNVLTLYNTSTDTEQQLIGPPNEIEVYHLNYVANGNMVLFDGLRFSDNYYVIGEVDLSTDQVSVVATSGQKLADLQAFG